MRSKILYWVIGLAAVAWAAKAINSRRPDEAIWRVFHEEIAIRKRFEGSDPATGRAMVEAMEGIDTSACPDDFRRAWGRRVASLKSLNEFARRMPQSLAGQLVQTFANYFGGQVDGGLIGQYLEGNQVIAEAEAARLEVRAIAAKYGAIKAP